MSRSPIVENDTHSNKRNTTARHNCDVSGRAEHNKNRLLFQWRLNLNHSNPKPADRKKLSENVMLLGSSSAIVWLSTLSFLLSGNCTLSPFTHTLDGRVSIVLILNMRLCFDTRGRQAGKLSHFTRRRDSGRTAGMASGDVLLHSAVFVCRLHGWMPSHRLAENSGKIRWQKSQSERDQWR